MQLKTYNITGILNENNHDKPGLSYQHIIVTLSLRPKPGLKDNLEPPRKENTAPISGEMLFQNSDLQPWHL